MPSQAEFTYDKFNNSTDQSRSDQGQSTETIIKLLERKLNKTTGEKSGEVKRRKGKEGKEQKRNKVPTSALLTSYRIEVLLTDSAPPSGGTAALQSWPAPRCSGFQYA